MIGGESTKAPFSEPQGEFRKIQILNLEYWENNVSAECRDRNWEVRTKNQVEGGRWAQGTTGLRFQSTFVYNPYSSSKLMKMTEA